MNFFNLFYKNLTGYEIKDSDLMCNNNVKKNTSDYSIISFTPNYFTEKYKIDKLIDKLKTDNRNYIFDDNKTFDDQLQKITDELNELKLINTIKGGGDKFKEMYDEIRSEPLDFNDLIYKF